MNMADPAKSFRKYWPKFFENGISKKCLYQVFRAAEFDPNSETQGKAVVSSEVVYIVFDKVRACHSDGSPLPSSRGGGSTLNGVKAIFPALDISVDPQAGHRITEEVSGVVWEVVGTSEDPVPAVYELEVVRVG